MVSKELQTKYIQLQLMKQQISAFVEEKNLIDEKVSELVSAVNTLNKLKDVKKSSEIWSQLGGSVFVRSDIKDVEQVLISVGAGVVLKKQRAEAIGILQSRLEELTNLDRNIVAELRKFSEQAESLEAEVQQLAEKEPE